MPLPPDLAIGDTVAATYRPEQAGEYVAAAREYIGVRMHWRAIHRMTSGPRQGQWAFEDLDDEGRLTDLTQSWAAESDLDEITLVARAEV